MMLLTIMENISQNNAKFVYSPLVEAGQYEFYSQLGLYPKFWYLYKRFQFGRLGHIIPKKLRQMYGIIIDQEINAVLDASGFAYSDQWGDAPAMIMAKDAVRWKRQGKKVIFLPQAFGPFHGKKIRQSMLSIIECADLIYARDQSSYESLKEIKDSPIIKIAPDFTALLKGEVPDYFDENTHQVCIIPNKRVLDKRSDSGGYVELLAKSISYLQEKNLSSYFLIHGGEEDRSIASAINDRLDHPISMVNEIKPKYIKGLLKNSLGVVGSRFHGIASALYSGTVAVGIGWSHKYDHLFSDMGFKEGLIDISIDRGSLIDKLNYIVDDTKREEVSKALIERANVYKEQTESMFAEVNKCLSEK